MEFDRSKVYTALNADELKIGSKVICANTIGNLKELVEQNMAELSDLTRIDNTYSDRRFVVNEDTDRINSFAFAYLVSEPEEKNWIAYLSRKSSNPEDYYLTACRSDRWESVKEDYGGKTKLFEGSEVEVDNWYVTRRHLANEIAAWEDGKTVQFFDESTGNWTDVKEPKWSTNTKYRIKPNLKWTDLKIGDIVRRIDTDAGIDIEAMVVAIDKNPATDFHVMIADNWTTDEHLAIDWEKVE